MTLRTDLLLTCTASALLVGGYAISRAAAVDTMPVKAPVAAPDAMPWWFHGYLEVGGRTFVNDPQRDGTKSQGGSLAKYYEYSTIAPGAYGDGHLSAGSKDGVYGVDIWAKNVGYSDQSYGLALEKAGEHYLNLTSAETLYKGVGTTALTLPPGPGAACLCGQRTRATARQRQPACVRVGAAGRDPDKRGG